MFFSVLLIKGYITKNIWFSSKTVLFGKSILLLALKSLGLKIPIQVNGKILLRLFLKECCPNEIDT